jgi:hypothetical protein
LGPSFSGARQIPCGCARAGCAVWSVSGPPRGGRQQKSRLCDASRRPPPSVVRTRDSRSAPSATSRSLPGSPRNAQPNAHPRARQAPCSHAQYRHGPARVNHKRHADNACHETHAHRAAKGPTLRHWCRAREGPRRCRRRASHQVGPGLTAAATGLLLRLRSTCAQGGRPRRLKWVTVDGGLPAGLDLMDRSAMHEWLRRNRT